LKFSDIGVLLAIVWIFYVLFGIRTKQKIRYSKFPALFVGIILISSIAAYHFFGQGFGLSLRQNRYIIVSMLLYYAIVKAMKTNMLLRDDVVSILAFQAVAEIMLFTLQYILSDTFIFIYTNIDSRYGTARLRVSYLLPLIFMYFCIDKILNNKYKIINLLLSVGSAFVLFGICKHRAPSIIMLVTFVAAYFLWRRRFSTKLLVGTLTVVVAVAFMTNSSLVQDSLASIFSKEQERNLTIRYVGQAYYLERLAESPIIGFGEPNENCNAAQMASGYFLNYFLADNGIFGFFYTHGIMGLTWLLFFWIKLFKESHELFKKKHMYQYILYILYETGNLYMGMHWYYYYAMPFVLCVALMDYDYSEAIEESTYLFE